MRLQVIDSHTGGEPTRTIIGGFPALEGGTMLARREHFARQLDHLRRGVVLEPRGSHAWVGALIVPTVPSADAISADLGVIFFNDEGYLGMCGHGTIGLVETLHHLGRLPNSKVQIDTPAGLVNSTRHDDGSISVVNVASFLFRADVQVTTTDGTFTGDVAYGGNWFFLIYDQPFALELSQVETLLAITERIRAALAESGIRGPGGELIDHIELFGPAQDPSAHSRNFVLCPGAAYDRSPCGTGTSAKLAALHARGQLALDQEYIQESITGSCFLGVLRSEGERLIPTITGRAFVTAESTLIFDDQDPFAWGISN
jgi:4-hydroxyproline epimerase